MALPVCNDLENNSRSTEEEISVLKAELYHAKREVLKQYSTARNLCLALGNIQDVIEKRKTLGLSDDEIIDMVYKFSTNISNLEKTDLSHAVTALVDPKLMKKILNKKHDGFSTKPWQKPGNEPYSGVEFEYIVEGTQGIKSGSCHNDLGGSIRPDPKSLAWREI